MGLFGLSLTSNLRALHALNTRQRDTIGSQESRSNRQQDIIAELGQKVGDLKKEVSTLTVTAQDTNKTAETFRDDAIKSNAALKLQMACRSNTNDKLRVHGQALVNLEKHIINKPSGKIAPGIRTAWNEKFDALWAHVKTTEVKQVTVPAALEIASDDKK